MIESTESIENSNSKPEAIPSRVKFLERLKRSGRDSSTFEVMNLVKKTAESSISGRASVNLLEPIREVINLLVGEGATHVSAAEVTKILRAAGVAHHKTPNYVGTLLGYGGLSLPSIWMDGKRRFVITSDEKVKSQLIEQYGRMTSSTEEV